LLASRLINDYKNKLSKKSLDVGKLVNDIGQNQDILTKAVNEYVGLDKKYLIDGLFTLLDSLGNIQSIPLSTFTALTLAAIVVLTDDPASIQKRLSVRDGRQFDFKLLKSMKIQELTHAEYVGIKLKIKVFKAAIGNSDHVKQIAIDLFKIMHK
jgi:adenylate kinase